MSLSIQELVPETTEAKLKRAIDQIDKMKKEADHRKRELKTWEAKHEELLQSNAQFLTGMRQLLRPNHVRLARDLLAGEDLSRKAAHLVYVGQHLGVEPTPIREFEAKYKALTEAKEAREDSSLLKQAVDECNEARAVLRTEIQAAVEADEDGWAHVYSDIIVECGLDGNSSCYCWRRGKNKAGDFAALECGCCRVGRHHWSSCSCQACVGDLLKTVLKWRKIGATEPEPGGRELDNPELAQALARNKTEFTQEEWDAFCIKDLRMDHFVKAGGSFFVPESPSSVPYELSKKFKELRFGGCPSTTNAEGTFYRDKHLDKHCKRFYEPFHTPLTSKAHLKECDPAPGLR